MHPLIRPPAEACYEFGPFRVEAANRLLLREGEVVPLTSKVFDILLVFVQNSGRLLDKDEVMREVWPDTVVEEGNLTRNVSTLRKALGESPHEHQYIVTVQGRGYRFVARVRESARNGVALTVGERVRVRIVPEEKSESARQIIRLMVLPFRMLRADPEVDFLAFGVPDAVAGALSVLDSVVVCSPAGAARYAEDVLDLKEIAREAQADAVLTGTILRVGDVIRVTCQLLGAPGGTVLWWHEPQVSMSDLYELQDDLVRRIVESLALTLSEREHSRLSRGVPTTATAYEFYLRGNELSRRGLAGFGDLTVARDLYLRCVEADPGYAPAWAQLGRCYRLIGKGMEHGRENLALAETAFRRALELNADLPSRTVNTPSSKRNSGAPKTRWRVCCAAPRPAAIVPNSLSRSCCVVGSAVCLRLRWRRTNARANSIR
ncbi:MAG: winged helix-turn-helix domain-containing protein [Acidobacteria bacterium]|nr:winged helix-turn-helix domain-containing protein [Acidobacteriota bacterium]